MFLFKWWREVQKYFVIIDVISAYHCTTDLVFMLFYFFTSEIAFVCNILIVICIFHISYIFLAISSFSILFYFFYFLFHFFSQKSTEWGTDIPKRVRILLLPMLSISDLLLYSYFNFFFSYLTWNKAHCLHTTYKMNTASITALTIDIKVSSTP